MTSDQRIYAYLRQALLTRSGSGRVRLTAPQRRRLIQKRRAHGWDHPEFYEHPWERSQ